MRLMRSQDKKRTAAFHLTDYVLRQIEQLARVRQTNKSHETENLLRQALELEPARSDLATTEATTTPAEVA